jgi:hypothetical protein
MWPRPMARRVNRNGGHWVAPAAGPLRLGLGPVAE